VLGGVYRRIRRKLDDGVEKMKYACEPGGQAEVPPPWGKHKDGRKGLGSGKGSGEKEKDYSRCDERIGRD